MLRWLRVALNLLVEAGAAHRDARVRFLKAQIEILRGNRVIPSPDDRARLLAIGQELDHNVAELLAIGQELDHNVADVIGIVASRTYCVWGIARARKRGGDEE